MDQDVERVVDGNTTTTEDPKRAWSKPAIRTMTVAFTQDGSGNRLGPEVSPDEAQFYMPPSS